MKMWRIVVVNHRKINLDIQYLCPNDYKQSWIRHIDRDYVCFGIISIWLPHEIERISGDASYSFNSFVTFIWEMQLNHD